MVSVSAVVEGWIDKQQAPTSKAEGELCRQDSQGARRLAIVDHQLLLSQSSSLCDKKDPTQTWERCSRNILFAGNSLLKCDVSPQLQGAALGRFLVAG